MGVVQFAKSVGVLSAIVAVGLAALDAGGAATKNPWIVFAASPENGPQQAELYRIRAWGTAPEQITTGRRPASDPAFAPDGRRVAFARLGSGLFVVNLGGSGLRRLTGGANDRYPVWSPDGRSIAFVRGSQSLWVTNANGRRRRRLRLSPPTVGRPSWTPDGKSIVLASDGSFYKVSAANGKVQKELAPTYDVSLGQLFWTLSPTGRTIAYVGRRPEPTGCERTACEVFALYLVSIASTGPRRFVDDAGVPGWSPDGRRLVYARGGALNLQSVDGGTPQRIEIGDLALDEEAPPAWQSH